MEPAAEKYFEDLHEGAVRAIEALRATPDDPCVWDACWEELQACGDGNVADYFLSFLEDGLVPPKSMTYFRPAQNPLECMCCEQTYVLYGAFSGPVVYTRVSAVFPSRQRKCSDASLTFHDGRPELRLSATTQLADLLSVCSPEEASKLMPMFFFAHGPFMCGGSGGWTGVPKFDALRGLSVLLFDERVGACEFRAAVAAKVLAGVIAIDDRCVDTRSSLATQTAHSKLRHLGPKRAALSQLGADPQQFLRSTPAKFPAVAWALLAGADVHQPIRLCTARPLLERDKVVEVWPLAKVPPAGVGARVAWACTQPMHA
jgi:hypothetical protein